MPDQIVEERVQAHYLEENAGSRGMSQPVVFDDIDTMLTRTINGIVANFCTALNEVLRPIIREATKSYPMPHLPIDQKYPTKATRKQIHRKDQVRKGQLHGGFNKRF